MPETITSDLFRAAMGSFAAGVTVVTTVSADGTPFGLTATAFSSVSKSPPLCLVCVAHSADAYPALRESKLFAVNVLERSQEHLSNRFATSGIDKFDGVSWSKGPATACPIIDGCLVSIECTTEQIVTAGDHDVFIGAIRHVELGTGDPLAYFRGSYGDVVPKS